LRAPFESARQPPWSLKLLIAIAVVLCVTRTGPLLPVAEGASLCFTPVKCVCPYGYKVKLSDPCMCVTCEFGECPHGVPQLYASCATIKVPRQAVQEEGDVHVRENVHHVPAGLTRKKPLGDGRTQRTPNWPHRQETVNERDAHS
jgi:hypothetical protein